jgi:hypothetical protein
MKVGGEVAAQQDHVQEYTRVVAFHGLCDMARMDPIREGDGVALNRDWRAAMLEFHNRNHTNYFAISCALLAGEFLQYCMLS